MLERSFSIVVVPDDFGVSPPGVRPDVDNRREKGKPRGITVLPKDKKTEKAASK
jgi:hypothetical protein